MINLCTVSDWNYLSKGLTLFESLKDTTTEFKLYYLCIDQRSFELVNAIDDPAIEAVHVEELIEKDYKLGELRDADYKYFCWSLASYLSNYLLRSFNSVSYIDSDIYFYVDFQRILGDIGTKEVGIFKHRQFEYKYDYPSGWFNVGVVHFKGTVGKVTAHWWMDAVMNKKYPHLSQCGDQKYLDAFRSLPEESLFIDGVIGHGAPWQWQVHNLSNLNEGKIGFLGKEQDLVFVHFSQFEYNLQDDTYIPSTMHHVYTPLTAYKEEPLKGLYDNYFNKIKDTIRKYNIE